MIEAHGLSPEEHDRIVRILGREPSHTELGIFSVMWSEHCSYKSSRIHLRTLPTSGPRVLQGPGENAGAVDIGDGLAVGLQDRIAQSSSRSSSPSRAPPPAWVASSAIFSPWVRGRSRAQFPPFRVVGRTARPARFSNGVVAGIAALRQQHRHSDDWRRDLLRRSLPGNPLVNVFCLGIARADAIVRGRASGAGNPVYLRRRGDRARWPCRRGDGVCGVRPRSQRKAAGRTGRRSFMEKLLLEACLELIATGRARWHAGHGRRGLDLFDLRDGRARRHGHRNRLVRWCPSARPA